MRDKKLMGLAEDVEAAAKIAGDLETRLAEALRGEGLPYAVRYDQAESVLGLVEAALPGWAVSLDGVANAANGHWRCTIRRTRDRDNDEAVGVAHGEQIAPALMAALLKVLSVHPKV